MSKKIEEIMEKVKAAKTPEEAKTIVKEEMPKIELSEKETSNVTGGTGRIELTDRQAENVVGGGHLYKDSMGDTLYVSLMDEGYVKGTDALLDNAYFLEVLASSGFAVTFIIDVAAQIFPGSKFDIEKALRIGGTVYLAECARSAHGYHFNPD